MLKKDIEYWAIEVAVNEWNSSIVECYDTLEEAEADIMRFADWCSDRGCCTILHFKNVSGKRISQIEYIKYWEGKRV